VSAYKAHVLHGIYLSGYVMSSWLVQGSTSMDESMVTGESVPVSKAAGDAVIGGTINCGGAVLMIVTRVGSDTVLNHIARLVMHAQMSKAPVQAFADRVSTFFVPLIVAFALLTACVWYVMGALGRFPLEWIPRGHSQFLFALLFGIAVLCVACPCALGLATPTAVMVGTGVAADLGVFIKSGAALERASKVDVVVFDKTGTITCGHPVVVNYLAVVRLAAGLSLRQLQAVVGSLEAHSEHPFATAVVSWAAAGAGATRKIEPFDGISREGTSHSVRHRPLALNVGKVCAPPSPPTPMHWSPHAALLH
jgi:P-type Cu+ transporter